MQQAHMWSTVYFWHDVYVDFYNVIGTDAFFETLFSYV